MRAVIHIDVHGNQTYFVDSDIDFIIVDERVPRDRVYQMSDPRVDPGEIDVIIGQSRIGKKGDMPGVEAEIRALINGDAPPAKPPLKAV